MSIFSIIACVGIIDKHRYINRHVKKTRKKKKNILKDLVKYPYRPVIKLDHFQNKP